MLWGLNTSLCVFKSSNKLQALTLPQAFLNYICEPSAGTASREAGGNALQLIPLYIPLWLTWSIEQAMSHNYISIYSTKHKSTCSLLCMEVAPTQLFQLFHLWKQELSNPSLNPDSLSLPQERLALFSENSLISPISVWTFSRRVNLDWKSLQYYVLCQVSNRRAGGNKKEQIILTERRQNTSFEGSREGIICKTLCCDKKRRIRR